jgi:inner membrane protein
MPSPIGHALAGAAVAWTSDLVAGSRNGRLADAAHGNWYRRAGGGLTVACIALAAAPDLDLLLPGAHRTFSHSLTAAVVTGFVAAGLAARNGQPVLRLALICAIAYASHILMDWLGVDNYPPRGIQMLWPFSDAWFISDLDVFRQTARRQLFRPENIRTNALAIAQEIAILLPIVAALWLVRVKALARLSAEMTRGDHAPQ